MYAQTSTADGIATLTLRRGKVNAVNPEMLAELVAGFQALARDGSVHAIVLTGTGSFFSFGWDVPEVYVFSPEKFTTFVTTFDDLLLDIFECPKPVVAAINGHAIAGGCMLAMACDRRLMTTANAKIALNEITFGATVFAGPVEMLRAAAGTRWASEVLESGRMYLAEEAVPLGLVDRVVPANDLIDRSIAVAREMSALPSAAFAGIKSLLRAPIADEIRHRQAESIRAFVDVWYSDATRESLKNVVIRQSER